MLIAESSIEAAIEALKSSPGKFQRLVECYAQLTYPHRFKDLAPSGRNPNDVTVKGWPDIYSISSDRRLDVAEATHSVAWPDHLKDDLEKAEALGPGRLAGFLFVAWDNDPSPLADNKRANPRYDKLMGFRDRLIALDVPSENINFVFKKQLVRTLTQPRFASVLKEILELPCHPLPFRLISQVRELFGLPGRLDVFAPTEEEYLKGLVHRTTITDEVEDRLESRGWAWVRGLGAAGKTVLAIRIALGYESESRPAYYLDLAKTDASASEALDVITTHADDQVLFIVDNIHLNEEFARDVFDHWQTAPMRSRLLLLGRDISISNARGIAHPLDELKPDALTLEVRPDDLAGVFLRLARRFLASRDYCSVPPHEVLKGWQARFGGDLIAFSAAVAHRIKALTQSDWLLQAQDAAKYVQEAYLERVSEAERRNLLRIAVLAQLEMYVPEEAIELPKIRSFLQIGLVHRLARGSGKRDGYQLVHPGLGDLLITAAGYSGEKLNQFTSEDFSYVAHRVASYGLQIVARLESAKREQEAISVLKSIIESEQGGVVALTRPGLQNLRWNCELIVRLRVLAASEIDEKLANEYSALSEGALGTPLGVIGSSLTYAERKLPKAYSVLATVFAHPKSLQALSEVACYTPLGALGTFLGYAERKQPKFYIAFVAALAQPKALKALSEAALRTSLSPLAFFLDYAEHRLPKVYEALVATLAKPDNLTALSEAALRIPLGNLGRFLDYVERKLPDVNAALLGVLGQPENLKVLTEAALRTPLANIGSFLEYVERRLPNFHAALAVALAQPENLMAVSQAALRMPLGDLSSFLGYLERKLPNVYAASVDVLAEPENLKGLSEAALHTPLGQLASFLDYVERKLPNVYAASVDVLSQPENRMALSDAALRTPLGQLASFLDYVERKLPSVYAASVDVLAQPENLKALRDAALRTPLDQLASFLIYAERKLPIIVKTLNKTLAEAEAVNTIARVACQSPLTGLLKFLRTAAFAAAVVAAIDQDEWDSSRLTIKSDQPNYFHALAKALQSLGRPELAEAPARALIIAAEPELWQTSVIGTHQLTRVMAFGRGAGKEAILRFLARVATPAWLEERYDSAHSYGIAASLLTLWGSFDQSILDHFRIDALNIRVTSEVKYLKLLTPENLLGAIELLGCSSLIGLHIDRSLVRWPSISQVCGAIQLSGLDAQMETIGHIQIQLWLGLREMARLRPDRIEVPPAAGDRMLALWKNAAQDSDKHKALSVWMIDWLERCACSGWILIPDHTYLPNNIAGLGE